MIAKRGKVDFAFKKQAHTTKLICQGRKVLIKLQR